MRKRPAKRKTKKAIRTVAPVIERVTKSERPSPIYSASTWERGSESHKILSVTLQETDGKEREFKSLDSVKIYPTHLIIRKVKGNNYTTKIIPLTGAEEIVIKTKVG